MASSVCALIKLLKIKVFFKANPFFRAGVLNWISIAFDAQHLDTQTMPIICYHHYLKNSTHNQSDFTINPRQIAETPGVGETQTPG